MAPRAGPCRSPQGAPTPASAPHSPSSPPLTPPLLSQAQRIARPGPPLTVQAEAALPAPAAVTAKAADAVDARAVAAARTVARVLLGLDLALVAVCDMGFRSCHQWRQPPPRPHSRPDTSRRRGRGHSSNESRVHSPKYLYQKSSCGEKRPRQGLSAHVCIRDPTGPLLGLAQVGSAASKGAGEGRASKEGSPLLFTSCWCSCTLTKASLSLPRLASLPHIP